MIFLAAAYTPQISGAPGNMLLALLRSLMTEERFELSARFSQRNVDVQQSQSAERPSKIRAHPNVREMRRVERYPTHFPYAEPGKN
jgi:hypothetical protein